MARLILKDGTAVLKEIPLQKASVTIGRMPSNDIVIENLAVSGHHARLVLEQDHFLVHDMNSLNGTLLNNRRIRKSALKDGDEILIGKHTLVFRDDGERVSVAKSDAERTQRLQPIAEGTAVPDTKKSQEFLAKVTSTAAKRVNSSAQEKIGCLAVLNGKTDRDEYTLTGSLTIIGKSDMASVRLRGWLAPKVAAFIHCKEGNYSIIPSDNAGATRVNSQPVSGPRDLKEGDLIEISGVKMQFFFRG